MTSDEHTYELRVPYMVEQAIVWWRDDKRADLRTHRMTAVETRDMLLRLAADLHETITGKRSGAVLVEDGEVMPALGALGGGPDRATDALRARLHDIHRTRMIR